VKEILKKTIAIKADALARRHRIRSKRRVRAIMERTAVDIYGRPLAEFKGKGDPLENGVKFDPSLDEALSYLPPDEALAAFESLDPSLFRQREQLINYFSDPAVPFYTLEELADLMSEYAAHLVANRESLIETGLPKTSFERCNWLDQRLSCLYFTKLPVSIHANIRQCEHYRAELMGSVERDVEGNLIYDYAWGEICPVSGRVALGADGPVAYESKALEGASSPIPRCSYEQASTVTGLTPEVAQRLDRDRGKLLDTQLALLNVLATCMQNHESRECMWNRSLEVLMRAWTRQEIDFYFQIDSIFAERNVLGYLVFLHSDPSYRVSWGGIRNLLNVIGHCLKESTIGTMSNTKALLLRQLPGVECIESYYHVIGKTFQPDVDRTLDGFSELEEREELFWPEFEKRVNKAIEKEFEVEVIVARRLKPQHAELYRSEMEKAAGWQEMTLRTTGKPALVEGILRVGSPEAELTDKQRRDYAAFEYKCYDKIHIPGDIPKGRSNLIVVNGVEARVPNFIFPLLVRLVEELKKKNGGSVKMLTLISEGVVPSEEDEEWTEDDSPGHHIYSHLRTAIQGYLLNKDGKKFIQNIGEKSHRISTHPDFITYDRKKLSSHPEHRIAEIAKRLPRSPKPKPT
jgi:hypothetical protein